MAEDKMKTAKQRSVDYNSVARVFDRRYQDNDYSGIQSALLEFVAGSPSGDVLEVGCGTGYWVKLLANQGYHMFGLEPARNMLEAVRQKTLLAMMVQGRAEELPFSNKSFDRIVCINAFHHFSDKERFIKEAYRILRPGGSVFTVGLDPHTGTDRWWIYDRFPQVLEIDQDRYLSCATIRQMLRGQGFVRCNTVEVQHMPIQLPARFALESGRLAKTSTSQLTVLSDDEYNQGIHQLIRDIETAESEGRVLTVRADLRIYATTGWLNA